jgi:hypothetical protein
VVVGQIGRGKSAFLKSYLWRQAVFGRHAWVVDPKGEYGPLAAAWDVVPVALRPGGVVRLNPLDTDWSVKSHDAAADDGVEDSVASPDGRRRVALTASLSEACLGRELRPRERAAIDAAVCAATRQAGAGGAAPTLPQVVDALLDPDAGAPLELRTTRDALVEDGRDAALELRRLVYGDLRGMFDGPTTPGLTLEAPLVVLDLSAVYHSPALGVLMACAAAWLQTAIRAHHRHRIILVVDEAWAILRNLGVARWLQNSWKLSRAHGVANVAVLHRLSDLQGGGPRRFGAGALGRRSALRLRDPGRLRTVAGRDGRHRRAPRPDPDRARSRHAAPAGDCRLEGGAGVRSSSSTGWRRPNARSSTPTRPWPVTTSTITRLTRSLVDLDSDECPRHHLHRCRRSRRHGRSLPGFPRSARCHTGWPTFGHPALAPSPSRAPGAFPLFG